MKSPSVLSIEGCSLLPSLLRFFFFYLLNAKIELQSSDFMLTAKRLLFLSFLFVAFPSIIIWNHIGFFLDDLLFSDWKNIDIIEPIFIIGNARSGTTWLHRLLSLEDSFTSMCTWEILFAPSVTWRKLFFWIFEKDGCYLRGSLFHGLKLLENYFCSNILIHPIGLNLPEEDEWVMMHIFSCQLVLFFFPSGAVILNDLILFDAHSQASSALTDSMKLSIFKYYRDCMKKHIYARFGKHALTHANTSSSHRVTYLSKNPPFTLRLKTLHKTFPDCKIICMVRDPVQSVPSMVSYIAEVWKAFSSPRQRYPNTSDLVGFCTLHYSFPREFFESNAMRECDAGCKSAFVSYSDLRILLEDTVVHLLERIRVFNPNPIDGTGLNSDALDSLRRLLKLEQEAVKAYKSAHVHSVQECCAMSEDQLRLLMAGVYDAHPEMLH